VSTVFLEHAAKEAGYLLPDDETENAIRKNLGLARDEEERHNWARETIRVTTKGAEFSDSEIQCFLDGFTVKEILAVRIETFGDIRCAHASVSGQNKNTPDATGREMAFCPSCRQMRPIVFGYVNQPTSAATLDLGGPVDFVRINNETNEETYCAACGHRVITDAEADELEKQVQSDKANWTFVAILAVLGAVVLVAMLVSVS